MPRYKIIIDIMPLKNVLDPQGEAIEISLKNSGNIKASNFRVGKKINFTISAPNKKIVDSQVQELCKKLLVNEVIEKYEYIIQDEKN
tara:strand:+ start:606 stop:866 length:261 start_codon:yes stop_codon:yes gene_type:complete